MQNQEEENEFWKQLKLLVENSIWTNLFI